MYDGHDVADEPIRRPAEPHGMRSLRNLMLLILHNAAQYASGRLTDGSRGTVRARSTPEAREARVWLLSADEHEPAVFYGKHEKVTQGASCRWLLRELGADPDIAQAQIRAMGWDELCNRLTIVTRSIRRGPETAPRKRPLDAHTGPQGDDRQSGDITLATRRENSTTAIVGATR